jgi:hypothetical protein
VVFSISIYVGYIFGKLYAFNFTSPNSDYYYLATHSQWRQLDDKRGELSAEAGVKRFHFSTGDKAVTAEYLPVLYASLPTRDFLDDIDDHDKLEALSAPMFIAETGVWVQVFNTAGRITQMQERLLMMASLATGGAIGFLWGAQDKGNANLPEFQNRLQSDTDLWRNHENGLRRICQAIRNRAEAKGIDKDLKEMGISPPAWPRTFHGKKDNFDDWVKGFYRVHPEMRACENLNPSIPSKEITAPTNAPK